MTEQAITDDQATGEQQTDAAAGTPMDVLAEARKMAEENLTDEELQQATSEAVDAEAQAIEQDRKAETLAEVREMGFPGLKALSKPALIALAERLDLATTGNKRDVRIRIEAVLLGGDQRHVHGHNLCPLDCGHVVTITSTVVGKYRRYRCYGCGARGKIAW